MFELIRWSDIDMAFKPNLNTGDIGIKKNGDSVAQHIRMLFVPDVILFKPEMESGIDITLFEKWNHHTQFIVRKSIIDHLTRYEPRIVIDNLVVDFDYDSRKLSVKMAYKINEEEKEINFSSLIRAVN